MNRRYHYSLEWTKPKPLVKRRNTIGVPERLDARGRVVIPLDEAALGSVGQAIEARLADRDRRRAAIAVCLLFSYLNPEHELRLAAYLRDKFPDLSVSLSHQVAPIWREYERGSTGIADAYVKPTIGTYVGSIRQRFEKLSLRAPWALLKSNGGNAVPASAFALPIQLLLSGLSRAVSGRAHFCWVARQTAVITLHREGPAA